MAVLKKTRGAQYPLVTEFVFNFNDTGADYVAGTVKTFGSVFTDNIVFMALPLPPNAEIVSGEISVETAYAGPTVATLSVGDTSSATKYASAVSLLAVGRTPITLPAATDSGGLDVQLTVNTTVANATAGFVKVRVMYVINGRVNEVQVT